MAKIFAGALFSLGVFNHLRLYSNSKHQYRLKGGYEYNRFHQFYENNLTYTEKSVNFLFAGLLLSLMNGACYVMFFPWTMYSLALRGEYFICNKPLISHDEHHYEEYTLDWNSRLLGTPGKNNNVC